MSPTHETTTDLLATCQWPDISPRYSTALREVTAFVFERFEVQALLAAGSVIRGEGDLRSDLDVFVLQERPYKQRIQRWFGDVPVEIFINPTRAVRAYFASEHERGRPSTAHMMATGFPVFGADVLGPLRAEAAAWLRKRSAFAPDEDTLARYTAATLLEDGEDVMDRDPAMASALFGEAVMAMIRYSLRVKRGTVPGNKSLLVELTSPVHSAPEANSRISSCILLRGA